MPKFRKKPVVIEAILWDGTQKSWDAIMAMGDIQWKGGDMGSYTFPIKTLEGYLIVRKGEYVIKGLIGEFYPCKPDIFEMTYDRVEDDDVISPMIEKTKLYDGKDISGVNLPECYWNDFIADN